MHAAADRRTHWTDQCAYEDTVLEAACLAAAHGWHVISDAS
jgi:hypothetical protein